MQTILDELKNNLKQLTIKDIFKGIGQLIRYGFLIFLSVFIPLLVVFPTSIGLMIKDDNGFLGQHMFIFAPIYFILLSVAVTFVVFYLDNSIAKHFKK